MIFSYHAIGCALLQPALPAFWLHVVSLVGLLISATWRAFCARTSRSAVQRTSRHHLSAVRACRWPSRIARRLQATRFILSDPTHFLLLALLFITFYWALIWQLYRIAVTFIIRFCSRLLLWLLHAFVNLFFNLFCCLFLRLWIFFYFWLLFFLFFLFLLVYPFIDCICWHFAFVVLAWRREVFLFGLLLLRRFVLLFLLLSFDLALYRFGVNLILFLFLHFDWVGFVDSFNIFLVNILVFRFAIFWIICHLSVVLNFLGFDSLFYWRTSLTLLTLSNICLDLRFILFFCRWLFHSFLHIILYRSLLTLRLKYYFIENIPLGCFSSFLFYPIFGGINTIRLLICTLIIFMSIVWILCQRCSSDDRFVLVLV